MMYHSRVIRERSGNVLPYGMLHVFEGCLNTGRWFREWNWRWRRIDSCDLRRIFCTHTERMHIHRRTFLVDVRLVWQHIKLDHPPGPRQLFDLHLLRIPLVPITMADKAPETESPMSEDKLCIEMLGAGQEVGRSCCVITFKGA